MSKRDNLYLVGLMGAGKTTVGRLLAKHYGCVFYDSDHEIEAREYQLSSAFHAQILGEEPHRSSRLKPCPGTVRRTKYRANCLELFQFFLYIRTTMPAVGMATEQHRMEASPKFGCSGADSGNGRTRA